jgi:preprotein translocase subunit YajC
MLPALFPALALMQPAAGQSPLVGTIGLYVVIFAIFYFVLLRPQQQQRKKHDAEIGGAKRGDEIITTGGVIGEIVHVKPAAADGTPNADDRITIKSADSRLLIQRGRIQSILKSSGATTTPATTPTKPTSAVNDGA